MVRDTDRAGVHRSRRRSAEEIDVEGLLGFAEYVLTNAAGLWMEATAEQRPRLQRALFAEGLRLRTEELEPPQRAWPSRS